jgi:phage gp29-like protein
MDNATLSITRRMAWCRAKGELLSILECYLSSRDGEQSANAFGTMNNEIKEFIKWMDEESPIA